ncbi:MAG: helix-turn-helix transcriptional regulator [bacterium]
MRKATDTALRYLALLQLLPTDPQRISIAQLQQKLRDANPDFAVSIRSIQRDLEKLSTPFSISCHCEGRTNYWYWLQKSDITQIPAMNGNTALAFKLASEYLRPLLPPSMLRLLQPHFNNANDVLKQTNLGKWSAKTRIISRGPDLIAPSAKTNVQDAVYTALLDGKRLEVYYQSKSQTVARRRVLNPLGLVVRNGIIYLVATAHGYDDPRHYALHRMNRANAMDKRADSVADFDLAHYIEQEQSFAYPVSSEKLKLCALFSPDAALHLSESKLSSDQAITSDGDGRVLVEATVADTAELRWWLMGFGAAVEIIKPRTLRDEFVALTEEMRNTYIRQKK